MLLSLFIFSHLAIIAYSQDNIIRRFRSDSSAFGQPPLSSVMRVLNSTLDIAGSIPRTNNSNRTNIIERVVSPGSMFGGSDSINSAEKGSKDDATKDSSSLEDKSASEASLEDQVSNVSNIDDNKTMFQLENKSLRVEKTPQQIRKELIDSSFAELMELMEEETKKRGSVPMDKYDPNISLVVPVAFDDLRSFPVLLSSLRLQTMRPDEIILVFDVPESETEARNRALKEVERYSSSLRNLRAFFRTPPPPPRHFPGSNRLFGASKAKNEIVMFFDSDDIIHPQRVEYVSRAFRQNPDMDVFLTEYFVEQMDTTEQAMEMPKKSMQDLTKAFDLDKLENKKGGLLAATYEDERNEAKRAVEEYGLKCPWNPNDRRTEINWPETHGWWLYCCHNGWLTIRRSVLIEVPYPDKESGEDSLYVFRLLMSGKNLGHGRVPLGIYVLGNTYRVR
ncbi:hypothetical protein FG386_001439 [Cryptosporidium ryanae]|uniref:uncharacterized protein n=1 Tax=Cryptosporidium ryanae TaxID=515981 RepID=UPI00351A3119|nr:hypothetical protein FG386_001439 [Cryptosporidium ryanae]